MASHGARDQERANHRPEATLCNAGEAEVIGRWIDWCAAKPFSGVYRNAVSVLGCMGDAADTSRRLPDILSAGDIHTAWNGAPPNIMKIKSLTRS